jgi:AcrR family transcriptional regulator
MGKKERKKLAIAEAAKDLFTNFGYKAVNMDSIAERANVGKGTIYLYFKDKETLFYYLLEEAIEEFNILLEGIKAKKMPLSDEIVETVYTLLVFRKNQKFLFKIMTEAREMNIQIAKTGVQMIDGQIKNYLESRLSAIIKNINPEILAFAIIKVFSALAFEWEEDHEPLDERRIAQTIGVLVEGVILLEKKD